MRGTARETARVMETTRTRREKARRTAGFLCGLPLGSRVRFGKWDATLEVGGCSCTGRQVRDGMARGLCRAARWMGELPMRDTAGCLRLIRGSLQSGCGPCRVLCSPCCAGCGEGGLGSFDAGTPVHALVFEACEVEARCKEEEWQQAERQLTNSPIGKEERRNGRNMLSSSESSEAA